MHLVPPSSAVKAARLPVPVRTWSFVLALLTLSSAACQAAGQIEVDGAVLISPARPGPQRIGEPSSKPFAGAEVKLRTTGGVVVAQAITAEDGRFRFSAPPGAYEVVVDTKDAAFPRCPSQVVEVSQRRTADVEIRCDSGMR